MSLYREGTVNELFIAIYKTDQTYTKEKVVGIYYLKLRYLYIFLEAGLHPKKKSMYRPLCTFIECPVVSFNL